MNRLLSTKSQVERGKCKFLFALILLTSLLLPSQNIFAQNTEDPQPESSVLYGINKSWDTFTIGYGSLPQGAVKLDENVSAFDWIGENCGTSPGYITKLTIDPSVKNFKPTNLSYWFYGLNNITSIEGITNLNTEDVTNMSYLFGDCKNLQKLDLSNFDTKKVESMSSMFSNCSFLKTIFVSEKWDMSGVTNANYMFNNCHKLYGGKGTHCEKSDIKYACIDAEGTPGYLTKSGDPAFVASTTYGVIDNSTGTLTLYYGTSIPNNDNTKEIDPQKSNSTWLAYEFDNYANIKKVVIDKSFKNFKPTTCFYWFGNCTAYEISGLENINTENVTDMTYMFNSCSNIKTLDLSSFNTQKVARMSAMFSYCTSLKTIYVSDKWTTAAVTNTTSMFASCPKLYGGKGTHCEDADIKYACIDAEGTPGYFTKSGDAPWVVPEPWSVYNKETQVLTIGYGTQLPSNAVGIKTELGWNEYLCSEIDYVKNAKKVIIDKSFANFKPTSCRNWFNNYSYVTEYEGLNYINTEDVTSMSYMFYYNQSIRTLDLSGFDTKNVTDMDDMFCDCKWLKTIYVSDKWNTSSVTDYKYIFSTCNKLYGGKGTHYTESDIKYACIDAEGTPGYFTKAGDKPFEAPMVYGKYDEATGTLSIGYGKTIPDGYTELYGYSGFIGREIPKLSAYDVKKIVFDESIKDFRPTMCYEWFSGCYLLTSIEGLTYLNTENVTNLGEMFNNCSSLTSLDLSGFNTKSVTYTYAMFSGCNRLKTIYVSDKWDMSLVDYSERMFQNCPKLYGSKGTHCEESDIKYAHVDKEGDPGYFTLKGEKPFLPEVLFGKYDKETRTFTVMYAKEAPDGFVEFDIQYGNWLGNEVVASDRVKKIVIDKSFAAYKPTSTYDWFNAMQILTEIEGVGNINTALTEEMNYMFSNCTKLKSLDLSSFNTDVATNMEGMFCNSRSLTSLDLSSFKTDLVKNMTYMFNNCINLKTIYVSDKWTNKVAKQSSDMFNGCYLLHGDKGTECNSSQCSVAFAQIDGGASAPGLFTKKGDAAYEPKFEGVQPYAVFADGTLTFFYDDKYGADIFKIEPFFRSWGDISKEITTVVFDKSFAGYKPNSVESWFSGCTNLTKIEGIENLNTEDVTSMTSLFSGCKILTSIDLSKFNTKKVRTMNYMFSSCESLTGIDVKYFKTDSLRSAYGMFSGCSNLKSIDLSTFKTDSVTDMSFMFAGCEKLTSLDLSSFNTKKVIYLNQMFMNCTSLKSVNLSSFDTKNVYSAWNMFQNCKSLETLDLSSFDLSAASSVDGLFVNCKNLKTIYVSDKWYLNSNNWWNSNLFEGCENLVGGKGTECIPGRESDKFAKIDGGESDPGLLTKAGEKPFEKQKENVLPYAVFADGTLTFRYDDKYTAGSYMVTKFTPEWTEIADKITKVVFDKSFQSYKPQYITGWFKNCVNLTTFEGLEYLNTENLIRASAMFMNCTSLTTIDLSHFSTANLEYASYMFEYCVSLTTIYVSEDWNTTNISQSYNFFYRCYNLVGGAGTTYNSYNISYAKIDGGENDPGYFTKKGATPYQIPALTEPIAYATFANGTLTMRYDKQFKSGDYKIDDVAWNYFAGEITKVVIDKSFADYKPEDCEDWFNGCENLTEIQGMENLNTEDVEDMDDMFHSCSKLQSIDLSHFKTDKVTRMENMFNGCTALTFLDLSSFNTESMKNSQMMFYGCENLKTILVSDKWTVDNVTTPYSMFINCYNLEGSEGTKYDPSVVNTGYAIIDGGEGNEGYLSKLKAVSIEFVNKPKTEYGLNEAFATENSTLTVKYNNNNTETVALSSAEISGFDPTKEGEQTVTISYDGAKTELTVKVDSSTPVSSVVAESNDIIRIWSYGHSLFVENAASEIEIFNTNGIPVMKQRPNADRVEFNISKSGIYIVKTGSKTQKVLIK